MSDFVRWVMAGLVSVGVAVAIFFLATVGLVVGLIAFLVLFVVFALAARKRSGVYTNAKGTQFVIFTKGFQTPQDSAEQQEPSRSQPAALEEVYDLSPEDYTIESIPDKKTTPSDGKEKQA